MSDPLLPPSAAGAPGDGEDAEHDAWLHEALRHAPDAAVSPPESLRKAILDEARAAAFASAQSAASGASSRRSASGAAGRRSRTAPAASGLVGAVAAFWSWLARPAVAAGFASVMAATLVGVMWWDRPLDDALPSATPAPVARERSTTSAPVSREPSATPAPVTGEPAAAASAATPTAPSGLAKAAPSLALQRAAEATLSPAPAQVPPAVPLEKRERADNAAASRPPAPAAAPLPFPASPGGNAAGSLANEAAPSRQAAPAEAAKKADADADAAVRDELRRARPASVARDEAADSAAKTRARLAVAAPLAAAPIAAEPFATASVGVAPPLSPVLASLASDGGRWTLQRASGERVAVDGALRAWLAQVDAAARWRSPTALAERGDPSSDAVTTGGAAMASALSQPDTGIRGMTLVLLHDGQADTTVRLEATRVVVERRVGGRLVTSLAPLAADLAASLAASFPPGSR